MNAKKMFEKLGYEFKSLYDGTLIKFEKLTSNYPTWKTIWFSLDDKVINFDGNIDANDIKAVNKMVEELGW